MPQLQTTLQPTPSLAADVAGAVRHSFFDFTPFKLFLVGAVVCAVQFGAAFAYGIMSGEGDFGIFLGTAKRFRAGEVMYSVSQVDFTPPAFHIFLIPLTYLDPRIAFVLWTAANLVVAIVVVRMCIDVIPGAWPYRWTVAAWVANAAGVAMTVRLGQVSWLVALLVLPAWLAARSSRYSTAGLLMGIAIAFKPFLLVALPAFLVRRQWRMLVACIVGVAAACGASIVLCGWEPFRDWLLILKLTPDPEYATHFLNSSWLALVARLRLPSVLATVLSIVTLVAMLWRVRRSGEDEAWLLVLLSAILACPMGWIYYQPLFIGPALAVALRGDLNLPRWLRLPFVVPTLRSTQFQLSGPLVAATLGSVYFWAYLGVFGFLLLRRRVVHEVEAARQMA